MEKKTIKNMEDIAIPLHLIFYIIGKMQKSASMIPILRFGGVIPTLRPLKFSAFIGRITRNLSLLPFTEENIGKMELQKSD